MNLRRYLVLVLALLLPTGLVAQTPGGTCYTYNNSSLSYYGDGYGYVCDGTGPGCTECTQFHPGGYEVCVYVSLTDVYCVDHGSTTEFQL